MTRVMSELNLPMMHSSVCGIRQVDCFTATSNKYNAQLKSAVDRDGNLNRERYIMLNLARGMTKRILDLFNLYLESPIQIKEILTVSYQANNMERKYEAQISRYKIRRYDLPDIYFGCFGGL